MLPGISTDRDTDINISLYNIDIIFSFAGSRLQAVRVIWPLTCLYDTHSTVGILKASDHTNITTHKHIFDLHVNSSEDVLCP